MEDENFELRRMELDHAIQAVPTVIEQWTQTDRVKPFSKAVQYEPRLMDEKAAEELLKMENMREFVTKAYERCVDTHKHVHTYVRTMYAPKYIRTYVHRLPRD